MTNSNKPTIGPIVKSLFITACKLIALVIAFTCKIIGLIITKIGEIFEKLSGNEHH